jgi:hypothetical protein
MAYITLFDVPEIKPEACTLRKQLEFAMVFHGRQIPENSSTGRLLTTYLITSDKAAREYIAGCGRIKDHMAGGGVQAFVEGVNHFETCINSAKRALRVLERIGAQRDGLTLDRTIRNLARSRADTITGVRDAIEHIDADILSETALSEGDAHLLTISQSGEKLEIGKNSITLVALHSVLDVLYRAGLDMISRLPIPIADGNK